MTRHPIRYPSPTQIEFAKRQARIDKEVYEAAKRTGLPVGEVYKEVARIVRNTPLGVFSAINHVIERAEQRRLQKE